MSAQVHAEAGIDQQGSSPSWTCPRAQADALVAAVNDFLDHPVDDSALDEVVSAINASAAAGPGGARALKGAHREQLKRDGGFGCRYVAVKWLDAHGQVMPLSHPVPARDRIPEQMAHIVTRQPEKFPHGPASFFERERLLLHARTGEFGSVVGEQIRHELNSLAAHAPVSHARLASIFDMSLSLRHQAQIQSAAHPAALGKIDAGDVASICDFLTVVAGRLPLSAAEFDRFLDLARTDWASDDDKDVLLRGRVVTSGLDGKAHLLQSWITPFVRELATRGMLARASDQYRASRRDGPATAVIRPPGAAAEASAREHDTHELAASDTSIHILEGAPEPERMHVLRNYVRCATACAVIPLDEALRIAQARPDVPGHRQHVIRLFHDEGWIMSPGGRGEPVFEKRDLVRTTGETAAEL
jgi:hypothetical protein